MKAQFEGHHDPRSVALGYLIQTVPLPDIDYAMLIRLYGATSESAKGRYSPAECIGARKERIEGNPDWDHVSTSYTERSNLNIRMHTRRFTRLTNAVPAEKHPGCCRRSRCFARRFIDGHGTSWLYTFPCISIESSCKMLGISFLNHPLGFPNAWLIRRGQNTLRLHFG
jgi:hypothetical protein